MLRTSFWGLALCALLVAACTEDPATSGGTDGTFDSLTDSGPTSDSSPGQDQGTPKADQGTPKADSAADTQTPTPDTGGPEPDMGVDTRAPEPDMGVDQGAPLACDDCHGDPPSSGRHNLHVNRKNYKCVTCHNKTVDSSGDPIANGAHQNGKKDVSGSFDWNGSRCSNIGCHGSKSW